MTAAKKQTKSEAKPEVKPQPQPQTTAPQPTNQKPEPAPSKQSVTISKLKQAWTEKGVSLKELSERQDGKFILLQPTPEWPLIRVGPTGGLELPQVRSFAKAWDACVDGLNVYQKQLARDAKKQAAASPKPAAPAPAVKPPAAETTTQKKQRQGAEIEKQLTGATA